MEEKNQSEKRNKSNGQLCFVKMLVNNLVAGSVIGKNGSIITSIENKTGCNLKLSPNNSYFPNTQERVLVLCGKQEQINSALLIILDKIRQIASHHFYDKQNPNATPKYTCRIVVPKSAVSAIIGKGGQQIKQLQDSTGSKIQISSREDGLNERIITIIGTFESISDTALKVANSIQSDPNLKDLLNVIYNKESNYNSRALTHNFINQLHLNGYVIPQQYGVFQHDQYMDVGMMNSLMRHSRDLFNLPCEISIQIPDEFIGSVIGKNGSRLTNIMNSTGAQIRISRKGELIPGTTDRKVRIIGTVAAVHAAHVLLLQRLESVYMQIRTMQVKCDA
ncbi:RNA-binding protein Nova-1, putative [Plasmodium gallinaceum]|uniref:RNA-binding protein Nova-1, putative n=1 Tax=Plasmodium gallinaceum TaxID=5849 RepID=A0A1J1GXD3_PLAGA|nr:RNA-binding protein Nova-1, putative [Plasmodium gallinaceum]CRG95672.1 RNA-binding protein Nova-1, putative [Plasmodium gallinaceum]